MRNTEVMPKANEPEELARLFIEQANQGNVEGLVALYEPEAILALPDGSIARGSEEIRRFYSALLAARPHFEPGTQRAALRAGDLALTSSQLTTGAVTAEVARQQADGSWLWVVDQPAISMGK